MTPCDLLVSARWLLPIAPENSALDHQALAISDGAIVAVGSADDLKKSFTPRELLDLDHHVVLPGLVNAHGHAAMTLLRGVGEDQSLQAWLSETIWPLEGRLVNAEFVRLGTTVAIAEMLASGTTAFSDMYFFPEQAGRAAIECGMSFFGLDRMLFATDSPFDPEQGPGYIRETLRAIGEMDLTDADRTAILSGNAERLLGLESSHG